MSIYIYVFIQLTRHHMIFWCWIMRSCYSEWPNSNLSGGLTHTVGIPDAMLLVMLVVILTNVAVNSFDPFIYIYIYIRVCVCVCVCVCIYLCVYVWAYVDECMVVCALVCVYTRACTCVYQLKDAWFRMFVFTNALMCVFQLINTWLCVYVWVCCVYVSVYVCISTNRCPFFSVCFNVSVYMYVYIHQCMVV